MLTSVVIWYLYVMADITAGLKGGWIIGGVVVKGGWLKGWGLGLNSTEIK